MDRHPPSTERRIFFNPRTSDTPGTRRDRVLLFGSRRYVLAFLTLTVACGTLLQFLITTWHPMGIALRSTANAQEVPAKRIQTFDVSRTSIRTSEIRPGGPPKDGIPALSSPKMFTARETTYLDQDDRVIGIASGNEARAYPLRVLNYHEIVNDQIGNLPILVSFCPLCDSAAVFLRRTKLGEHEFGVSGLLYNSNVLMYDRRGMPESLWNQLMGKGVSGPGIGIQLETLPFDLTTWKDWTNRYPTTVVLSNETGHVRNYGSNPYEEYRNVQGLMFPVSQQDNRLPTKTLVLGLWTDRAARAYIVPPSPNPPSTIKDEFDGGSVTLHYAPEFRTLRVIDAGKDIHWLYTYWFAWVATHPETSIYNE